jgi:hypothetical protein
MEHAAGGPAGERTPGKTSIKELGTGDRPVLATSNARQHPI